MFDIYAALSGGMIANLLLTILGLVISVAAGILLQLVTYGCMGLYSSFRGKSFANETGKLTAALFLDGMAMIALLYVIQIINF